MARDLTKKQRGFVKDIIKTGHITKSALNNYDIEAEDKENCAAALGSKELRKDKIQKALKPAIERYQEELDEILAAMKLKNKNSEQYKVLVEAANIVQKQIQLLGGEPTERIDIPIDPKKLEALNKILDK